MRVPGTMPEAAQSSEPEFVTAATGPLDPIAERLPPRHLVAKSPAARDRAEVMIAGVRIGQIVMVADGELPLVDFLGNPTGGAVAAQTTVRLTPQDLQRGVVLMFEDGSPRRPVILGLLEPPSMTPSQSLPLPIASPSQESDTSPDPKRFMVEADGRRVMVTADQELVLRCGKASITLTKAGKVIVRGAYLLSRSSGVNRIKGGSVQIN